MNNTLRNLRSILLVLISLFPLLSKAQDSNWDVYMAQYENGAGSVVLDMDLKTTAPDKTLPFVLITGVKFKACQKDGMPLEHEFDSLYRVSDSAKALIDHLVKNRMAGTFTYQCERLDYYYLADTAQLRTNLARLYAASFPGYQPYINIKADKDWKAYLEFLYPNEETYEYMKNQKVVMKLAEAGDKLDQERLVDHFAYFPTENDRECFVTYATQQGFTIASKERSADNPELPFYLHMTKVGRVDIHTISQLTLTLEREAKKCNGNYDGWETILVK